MLSGFLGLMAMVTSAGLIASGSETLTTRCANAACEDSEIRTSMNELRSRIIFGPTNWASAIRFNGAADYASPGAISATRHSRLLHLEMQLQYPDQAAPGLFPRGIAQHICRARHPSSEKNHTQGADHPLPLIQFSS